VIVVSDSSPLHYLALLGKADLLRDLLGEVVICLAQELHADLLLADDKKARRIAQQRGLVVTGTLAVLRAAHDRGLVRLPEMIRQLRGCGFRMSENLSRHVCSEAERRPGADTPGVS